MRVLIANPAFRKPIDDDSERYFFGAGCRAAWSLVKKKKELPRFSMFPFFMAYAAALLERDGFDVKAVDGVPLNLEEDEFIEKCVLTTPDAILFEPATININYILGISRNLFDRTGARIVFAGPHATVFAKKILEDHDHIEVVLLGEYETTFLEIVRRWRRGLDHGDARGICFRGKNAEIKINVRGEILKDLDFLPPPARHLFPSYFNSDMRLYHDGFCQKSPAVQMHSSRGCSFKCSYCLWNQSLFAPSGQRRFSSSRVVDEMKNVVKSFGAREIYFDDDDFTQNRDHVFALCDAIEKEALHVPWSVMGDMFSIDEALLARMAGAGCIGMKFGIESVDPHILRGIRTPADLKKVERLIKVMRRLRMKSHMTVMFGLPGETIEGISRTFKFACDLDLDSVQFHIATPYPGTALFTKFKQEGKLTTEDWEQYDAARKAVFRLENIDSDFLEQFRVSAYSTWLKKRIVDPAWIMHQLPFLWRIIRGQGIKGIQKRVARAFEILKK